MQTNNCATYKIGSYYYLYTAANSQPCEAVKRFKAMLSAKVAGGFAEKFIRANLDAELTSGHCSHLDTAFRYTMDGEQLTVEMIESSNQQFEISKIIFNGPLTQFIDEYETTAT